MKQYVTNHNFFLSLGVLLLLMVSLVTTGFIQKNSQKTVLGVSTKVGDTGDCGDLSDPKLPGYVWKADCSPTAASCDRNEVCPQNVSDPKNVNGSNNTSNWCYGFSSGFRCLQLQHTTGAPTGQGQPVAVEIKDAAGQKVADKGGNTFEVTTPTVQIAIGSDSSSTESNRPRREYIGREKIDLKDSGKPGYYQEYDLWSDGAREPVGQPLPIGYTSYIDNVARVTKIVTDNPDDKIVKVAAMITGTTEIPLSLSGQPTEFDLSPLFGNSPYVIGFLRVYSADGVKNVIPFKFTKETIREIKSEDDGVGGCCEAQSSSRVQGCEQGSVCAGGNLACTSGYMCVSRSELGYYYTQPTENVRDPKINYGIDYSAFRITDEKGTLLTEKSDGVYKLTSDKVKISVVNVVHLQQRLELDSQKYFITYGRGYKPSELDSKEQEIRDALQKGLINELAANQAFKTIAFLRTVPTEGDNYMLQQLSPMSSIPASCKIVGPAPYTVIEKPFWPDSQAYSNSCGDKEDLSSMLPGETLEGLRLRAQQTNRCVIGIDSNHFSMGEFHQPLGSQYLWKAGGFKPFTQASEDPRWVGRAIQIAIALRGGGNKRGYWNGGGLDKLCNEVTDLKEQWLLQGKMLPTDDELEQLSENSYRVYPD